MAYDTKWEPEGIYRHHSGFVTGREMIESAKQTQSDPRFDEMRYVIDDFTDITGHDLSIDAFTYLAASNYGAHASNPNCRLVYVTTDTNLVKIIRGTLMSPDLVSYEVEVKPTLSEARDWLDSLPRKHEISSVMGFIPW